MNKHLFGGIFIMILAIVLAIIMMALDGWLGNCQPGEDSAGGNPCFHLGLRMGKIDGFRTFSLESDDCNYVNAFRGDGKVCDRSYEGGTIILATGIIAFVIFIASVVLLTVAHRNGAANYRYGALFGLKITSFLMILGSVLYSYKQLAGYSFILMVISGFFYFMGIALIVTNGWKISLHGDTGSKDSGSNGTGATRARSETDEAI